MSALWTLLERHPGHFHFRFSGQSIWSDLAVTLTLGGHESRTNGEWAQGLRWRGEPGQGAHRGPQPRLEGVPLAGAVPPPSTACPGSRAHGRWGEEARAAIAGTELVQGSGGTRDAVWPCSPQGHLQRRRVAQLFGRRIRGLPGGLLVILQSTVVFCHSFSKCIFSSRTQGQADCASSEAERCCQGPGTGCRPHPVHAASHREAETQGLMGHSHALRSVVSAPCWGAGCLQAASSCGV